MRASGALILVDMSGPLLETAADARADLPKPNQAEVRAVTGTDDVISGAQALIARGAGAVAVSCGEKGMVIVAGSGEAARAWRAVPPEVISGNPTGAGDAAVAALTLGLQQIAQGASASHVFPDHIRHAVALSASAVLAPVAGMVDVAAYKGFLKRVVVEELNVAG